MPNEDIRIVPPSELLKNYQSGKNYSDDELLEIDEAFATAPSFQERLAATPYQSYNSRDYIEEARDAGFGTSRYDSDFAPGMDLEQARALEQSGWAKIGSGIAKGGVTAAATAINTTAGTVFGVGSALFELMKDHDGDGVKFMDVVDAGTNNWLSQQTLKLQNWSEEAFPNYRTAEERSEQYQREWYKHMGTANFIGDSLLKNFGFTVGAVAGGIAWSKLIGLGLSSRLGGNILKGAVAAAEGDAEAATALKAGVDAVRAGAAAGAVDGAAVVANSARAASRIGSYGPLVELFGSVVGAMGEGTVEGLMAKQEYLDKYREDAQNKLRAEYEGLEQNILNSGDSRYVNTVYYQPSPDQPIQKHRELTSDGKDLLEARQRELVKKYQEQDAFAEDQGERLASTTFLLNLPILTTSNLIQFGRLYSGGFTTARATAAPALKGGIATSANELGEIGVKASYAAKNATTLGRLLNAAKGSAKVALSEASEEMLQGTVSSGATQVADNRISSFNDLGYDDEATNSVREWFEGMYKGGSEYLGDIKNWQEGALGAITGLFGMPGRRWTGGIIGSYLDASDEAKESARAANELNTLVNSEGFQDRWRGYIRHLALDRQMKEAADKNDEYAWHTKSDQQLINDIALFSDSGKLDDLEQIVSAYSNVSDEQAEQIRSLYKDDKGNIPDVIKKKSKKDIAEEVSERAKVVRDEIQRYKEIYDSLVGRAPAGASKEFLREMVFTAEQIKMFEDRYLKMLDEVTEAIKPVVDMADEDERGALMMRARQAFSGRFPNIIPNEIQKQWDDKLLDALEKDAETLKRKDVIQKVQDMRKVSDARKEFYRKLVTLQGEKAQEKFNDEAVTPAKVEDAAEKAYSAQQTEGLNTFDDVKQAYIRKNAKGRADFMRDLAGVEDANPAVKSFMNLKRRYDNFRAYTDKKGFDVNNPLVTPNMLSSAMTDILYRAKSEEDLINLPDNLFPTYDEFSRDFKTLVGPPPIEVLAEIKKAMRDAMNGYMQAESETASRKTVATEVKEQPSSPAETPRGYDAAQPGSVLPGPEVKPEAPKVEAQPEAAVPVEAAEPGKAASRRAVSDTDTVITPDTSSLIFDAGDAVAKEDAPASDVPEDPRLTFVKGLPYYRTSVPEIDSFDAKRVRDDLEKHFKPEISLDDFVLTHPEYAETWNALKDRGAFDNTANVEVGDEIEFVIDPTFPRYENRPQILMTTVKDGERQVLNVLSQQEARYSDLDALRSTIFSEYNDFIKDHPNQMFVFREKSRVFAKLGGLIDYDYNVDADQPIKNIPGYDANAPIVFINRDNKPMIVSGEKIDAKNEIGHRFNDPEWLEPHKGNLYYLVKQPHGNYDYIPIRLGTVHFRTENQTEDNPAFDRIRNTLTEIANIVSESNENNLSEQNEKMRVQLKALYQDLDIHTDFFEIGDYQNVGVALRYSNMEENNSVMRRPDQMSPEWMINFIAGLGRSIQVHERDKKSPSGETITYIDNIKELIDDGMITSNARKLRPKGVDFWIMPWSPRLDLFAPATESQEKVYGKVYDSLHQNDANDIPFGQEERESYDDDDDERMFDVADGVEDSWVSRVINKRKDVSLRKALFRLHSDELEKKLERINARIAKEEAKTPGVSDLRSSDGGSVISGRLGRLRKDAAAIEMELSNRSDRQKTWSERIGKIRPAGKSERLSSSLPQMAALFHSLNKDAELYSLFGRVYHLAETVNIPIKIGALPKKKAGRFSMKMGDIVLDLDKLSNSRVSDAQVAKTITHELIHSVTAYMLDAYTSNRTILSDEQVEACREIIDIYKTLSFYKRTHRIPEGARYGLRSAHEMVAEMANPKFRAFLKTQSSDNIWTRLKNAVKRLLGITVQESGNMYERLSKAFDELLNQFTPENYSELREEYLMAEEAIGSLTNEDVNNILHRFSNLEDEVPYLVQKKMSEYSESMQSALRKKGYTNDEFDAMPDLLKQKVLHCL